MFYNPVPGLSSSSILFHELRPQFLIQSRKHSIVCSLGEKNPMLVNFPQLITSAFSTTDTRPTFIIGELQNMTLREKEKQFGVPVAHACNPSYLGG
jgi:hypothetical protein